MWVLAVFYYHTFFNTALLVGYNDPVVFVLCGLLLEEKQVDCTQNQEDCLLWQGLVVKYIIIIVSYIIILLCGVTHF